MKKIALRIVALMSLALAVIPAVADNTITYNATYDFGSLSLGTDTLGGVTYTTVSYDDMYNGGAPGKPSLPIDYIRFSVPWNAVNFTVSATLKNNLISTINYPVYPCQQPRLMNDTTPVVITLPDSSAYYANTYYPAQNAWVVGEGYLAGENHLVTVAVMPMSYLYRKTGNVDTHRLRKTQTVQLTLSYELSDSLAMYPIIRQGSTLRQEGFALTRSMVVNPNNVATFAPMDLMVDSLLIPGSGGRGGGLTPPDNPIDTTSIINDTTSFYGGDAQLASKYPYLIVTTPELKHSVRRIAALKRQKGYKVNTVSINEVLESPYSGQGDLVRINDSTYQVVDTTAVGKLRQYLKYCYRYFGTRYVLLVGDTIPYKLVPNTYIGENLTFMIISDLYYSDLNSDWEEDTIDYFPELYVGRILSDNPSQIANYTDKLFRYELKPGGGDYSYLKRAFFSRGREFEEYKLKNVKSLMSSIFPNQIDINDTIGNNSYYPTGKNIIDTLNINRVGFASILNHGDPTRIRVYGRDSLQRISFIQANNSNNLDDGLLKDLTNKKYPMIYYAPSCMTIPFDYNSEMNFGKVFTTGKDFGGPVYIGYTRSIIDYGAKLIFEQFAKELKKGNYHLGIADALSKGLFRWESTHNEIMSHAYLGDPEVEIWTDIPTQYTNVTVLRTNNSVRLSGIDADSTIVVFCTNNGAIHKKIITTDSIIINGISPNSSIMLYKHNRLPYIAPLELQQVELKKSQYVIAGDVTAGNSINSNRTSGDVIVKIGVEYEIEASGTVTLQDGFIVEKGATFAVYPSSF